MTALGIDDLVVQRRRRRAPSIDGDIDDSDIRDRSEGLVDRLACRQDVVRDLGGIQRTRDVCLCGVGVLRLT